MVDLVEAGRDVTLQHPPIPAGGEQVNLGDRVLGAASGAEAVGARPEVRLEDRLQHQLERGLHHPVPHGRDAQPAELAARLGDHPLTDGQRPEGPSLQLGTQVGQERLLAAHPLDVEGRLAIHPSGARTLVAPHPAPPNQQERRITDEVEQVTEPAPQAHRWPSMQLGLDPQYPCLRLFRRRPRRAGIHRRPPGLPAPSLQPRCRPSPCPCPARACDRLSRPPTTTAAPSPARVIGRRRTCPPPAWLAGGKGDPGRVSHVHHVPVGGIGAQLFPCSLATATPQAFTVASKPANPRPTRSRPPQPSAGRALPTGPDPPGLEPAFHLRGFHHWFLHSYTCPPCLPGPGRLAVPTRPVVVEAAPTLPGASRVRLPPASPGCCDNPAAEPFHLRPVT